MKRKIIAILFIFLLNLSIATIKADDPPPENAKGISDAWFSEDGISWEQSTTNATLKLGQPFYIKTYVKAKIDLNFLGVTLKNLGGPPYDFLLVEKPNNIPDHGTWNEIVDNDGYYIGDISIKKPVAGEEYYFIWKLRVNPESDWWGAKSPVNFNAGFTKDGTDNMAYTVVNIFIKNEVWDGDIDENDGNDGDSDDNTGESQNTSGFELIFIVLALIAIIVYRKKLQKH